MNPAAAERPVPVLPSPARRWPLHGVQASREIERDAAAALPPHTLMQRAGLSVARLALAIAPHARRVWVAAGPGNNGGDGLLAATWLKAAGREVVVSLLGDADRLPPDAAKALQHARDAGVAITGAADMPFEPELAIDALLGLGSRRAPDGALLHAIGRLNEGRAPVLAVDLPSGLDAATGALFGATAVRAQHTLSLLTLKPGLFTAAGRDHAGAVWVDLLGVQAQVAPQAWLVGADDVAPTRRRHGQHKGSFGDVVVVGGAPGMGGAAWLAARAALAAGAGRVFVDALDNTASWPAAPELMCRPGMSRTRPQQLQQATVVAGCGGGEAIHAVLPALLEHSARLVLDADGLNAVAADPALQALLAARGARGQASLLTPHPLEAARLLGTGTAAVQQDRLANAQQLALRFGCAVLLKGSGTVCAVPDSAALVNPTGNALLATAGTGDVLAGWAGGLWAQADAGAGSPLEQAQQIGAAAAWHHGWAADRAAAAGRETALHASALIDAMAAPRA